MKLSFHLYIRTKCQNWSKHFQVSSLFHLSIKGHSNQNDPTNANPKNSHLVRTNSKGERNATRRSTGAPKSLPAISRRLDRSATTHSSISREGRADRSLANGPGWCTASDDMHTRSSRKYTHYREPAKCPRATRKDEWAEALRLKARKPHRPFGACGLEQTWPIASDRRRGCTKSNGRGGFDISLQDN